MSIGAGVFGRSGFWDEPAYVVAAAVEVAHHCRADVLKLRQSVEEHGLYAGNTAVCVGEITLVLIVCNGAHTAQYEMGAKVLRHVDGEAVVARDLYTWLVGHDILDLFDSFGCRPVAAFRVVDADSDYYTVEELKTTFYYRHMADGEWVECARIKGYTLTIFGSHLLLRGCQ